MKPGRIYKIFCIFSILSMLAVSKAYAARSITSPYVDKSVLITTWRGEVSKDRDNDAQNGAWKQRLSVGYGFTDWFYLAAGAIYTHTGGQSPNVDGLQFLSKIQLTPEGNYWIDSGVATPLFLALIMVEIADIVFAVDSIPAIFAITTDPYIVYTSNIFAILGLRALYFALAAMMHRFVYLKYALSAVLIFIGGKIFWGHLIGKVDPMISLSVTIAILASGIIFSLIKTRNDRYSLENKI